MPLLGTLIFASSLLGFDGDLTVLLKCSVAMTLRRL